MHLDRYFQNPLPYSLFILFSTLIVPNLTWLRNLFYSVLSCFDNIGLKVSNESEKYTQQELELSSFVCKISSVLYFYINVILIITLIALCPRLVALCYKKIQTLLCTYKKANISCILILQKASCCNFLKRTNRERVLVFNENYIGERKLNCCWVCRMSAPGICLLCASASPLGTEDSLFHRDMWGLEHRYIARKTHRLIPLCNSASDRPLLGNCVLLGANLK